MRVTEKELTRMIEGYLNIIPDLCFKKIRGSMGMKVVLDLVVCYEGRYYELEVKTDRGRVTPEQRARIEAIRRAGG
jgi:hypothetical protein